MTQGKAAVVFLALVFVAGCTSVPLVTTQSWIDPGQAVLRAAGSPRLGVTGVFALTGRGTGRTNNIHLNSEVDYRDPRNLSISVTREAAAQLEEALGAPPEVALRGRRILVSGTARRTRIDFMIDGKPSGKYYYQTHVRVTDASQLQLL